MATVPGASSKPNPFTKPRPSVPPTGGQSTPTGPVLVTPSGEKVGSASPNYVGGGSSPLPKQEVIDQEEQRVREETARRAAEKAQEEAQKQAAIAEARADFNRNIRNVQGIQGRQDAINRMNQRVQALSRGQQPTKIEKSLNKSLQSRPAQSSPTRTQPTSSEIEQKSSLVNRDQPTQFQRKVDQVKEVFEPGIVAGPARRFEENLGVLTNRLGQGVSNQLRKVGVSEEDQRFNIVVRRPGSSVFGIFGSVDLQPEGSFIKRNIFFRNQEIKNTPGIINNNAIIPETQYAQSTIQQSNTNQFNKFIAGDPVVIGKTDVAQVISTGANVGSFAVPVFGSTRVTLGLFGKTNEVINKAVVAGPAEVFTRSEEIKSLQRQKIDIDKPAELSQEEFNSLSGDEKTAYRLEARAFNKAIDDEIARVKLSRAVLPLVIGGAVVIGGVKGYKFAAKPTFREVTGPSQTTTNIVIDNTGEQFLKANAQTRTVSPQFLVENTRLRDFLGKAPKQVYSMGAREDLTVSPMVLGGDLSRGISATRRQGRDVKLITLTEQQGKVREVAAEELGSLQSVEGYVFKEVNKKAPRVSGEENRFFIGEGTSQKGVPIKRPDIRFNKFAGTEGEIQILKRPKTTSEVEKQLSFIETRPVITTPDVEVYDVITGVKRSKSELPRRSGNVEIVRGKITVRNIPNDEPSDLSANIIKTKGTPKRPSQSSVLSNNNQELAAQAAQLASSAPKPLIRTPKNSKVTGGNIVEDLAEDAPTIVGGSGRRASAFAAGGSVLDNPDITTTTPGRLPALSPLSLGRSETGTNLQDDILLKVSNNQRENQQTIQRNNERLVSFTAIGSASSQSPRQPQSPREKIRLNTLIRAREILRSRTIPRLQTPPRLRLTPRPPRVPVRTIIKTSEESGSSILDRAAGGKREAFDVIIGTGKRARLIGRKLPRGKALKLGTETNLGDLSASFKLQESGFTSDEDINFTVPNRLFRPGKRDSARFVQRKGGREGGLGRLASFGERKGIQSARRRKQIGGFF